MAPTLTIIPDQPEAPLLVTELPGPKAAAIIELDERFTSPSYTRDYPLVIKRGVGLVVEDPDGNLFLDFTAGIAVCASGHSHPYVVKAIQDQAANFLHMSGTDFFYDVEARLAERLSNIAPMAGPNRVLFTNSGAESVEGAFKLARHHTGRKHVIAFYGAFHGRTLGALSLTASKSLQRQKFSPLIPEVTHVPYPRCYSCRESSACTPDNDCCGKDLDELEHIVLKRKVAPEEVAAIFVEALQGEGGYVVPPVSFMVGLRRICDEHGMLLVCDEVQSGMGRTGKMFAIEHFGVEPDIVTLAKGIASGMPLGALVTRESVMTWGPGSHASTFGGNPVSCAAALATLDLLDNGLLDHVEKVGAYLIKKLRALQNRHSVIGDVRGMGLMAAIDFFDAARDHELNPDLRDQVVQGAFRRGLLLLGCGDSAIRFSPALVVSEAQIDTAVGIVDGVLSELVR